VRKTQTDENVGNRIRGQGHYGSIKIDLVDRHTIKGMKRHNHKLYGTFVYNIQSTEI